MIDREKRNLSAQLIRQFLDGEITSDDLESEWPDGPGDRALEAISSMVWSFYDDFRPRRMVGAEAADPVERQLLNRYAAFLETDFEYDWPISDFIRLGGLGALVPLTLGLLWPIDRWIKSRNAALDTKMTEHGDWSVWPFTQRADWGGEPIPPFVR